MSGAANWKAKSDSAEYDEMYQRLTDAAWELARDVRHAAQMLASGEIDAARTILAERRDLIAGLRQEIEGWSQDAELLADEAMLTDYLAALAQGTHHRMLAESLRYAAYRKLQTAAR